MSLATFFLIACFAVGVQSARVKTLTTISEVKKVNATVGEFVCGSILNKEAACYPKARSGWFSEGNTTACTSQCSLEDKTGHFAKMVGAIAGEVQQKCTCPHAKESCRSVNGENPGVLVSFPPVVGSWTGPVKVEVATGNWQYLTKTDKWEGAKEVTEWSWVYPDQTAGYIPQSWETGYSFMDHRNVVAPSDSLAVTGAGDICEPGAAAKYYLALQNL